MYLSLLTTLSSISLFVDNLDTFLKTTLLLAGRQAGRQTDRQTDMYHTTVSLKITISLPVEGQTFFAESFCMLAAEVDIALSHIHSAKISYLELLILMGKTRKD